MKRFDAVVPEDVVHDSEMLEKSLSALRVSLKAEQLEAELAAESEARERAEAQNAALNARLAVLAAQQWYSGATDGLAAYRALGTRQWAYLLVLSVGIYLGAMQLQLIAIRQLGPTMLAAGCRRLAPDGDSRHLLPLLWLLAAPQTLPVAALEYPWGAGLLLAPLATLPSSYTHSGSQRSCPCDCSLPYLAPRPYWASMCRAHSRRWACCLSP